MKTEQKQITVNAYRDDENNPCCAKDFSTGEVCIFYRTKKFGCAEVCALNDGEYLERRKNGNGTLIPIKKCLIWS